MKEDDQIISLRDNIKKAAEIKVKNGTLSVTRNFCGKSMRQIKPDNLNIYMRYNI